ncbi:peptidoglycan-binding protein [Tropicimonas sp. IMCC34043]|uniref:peptidoglycan-binding protein n=1 Tax=Tropicimonas sp. IMCC34043 TaxID=2248760 RepID=UPI0018E57714|nr:peptidoglycan-binding protein [Tropicimonas sp. IMCC34043]
MPIPRRFPTPPTLLSTALALIWLCTPAGAQQTVWVQLESARTLALAQSRARDYAGEFRNIGGFRVDNGWYAIALGPYEPETAAEQLAALRGAGRIPSDAFVAEPDAYGLQFWPVGANSLNAPPVVPERQSAALPAAPDAAAGLPDRAAMEAAVNAAMKNGPDAAKQDETVREAQASEALLDLAGRQQIQEALKWAGVYDGQIDGAFGPGTRRAMVDWQNAQGHTPTGILTTSQRAELIDQYQAVFREFGLTELRDDAAGIEILAPMAKLAQAGTEAPFVRYDGKDGLQLVLISQSGSAKTLAALYDVLQTLEIVPTEGFRELKDDSFVLTGQSADLNSYTYAVVSDGAVKGFTLAWTPRRDAAMQRIAEAMQASFRPVPGVVLPDNAGLGNGEGQSIDLLSGLEIRRPERTRSGFYVDATGTVLTTTDLLAGCSKLTIGPETEAQVTAVDKTLGLALLVPVEPLVPIDVARFRAKVPRLGTDVTVAGFSYGDVLDLPVMSYGQLQDIRGLNGETSLDRLHLVAMESDAGGPVFGPEGAVLGMLQARPDAAERQLPADVNFAVDVLAIADFLDRSGLTPMASDSIDAMAPEDIAALAGNVTVSLSCWK